MTGHPQPDPLDQLRRANPVRDDVPSESYARIRARIQEVIAMEPEQAQTQLPGGLRLPWPRAGRLVAGGVLAAGLALALVVGSGAKPGVEPGPPGGQVSASCVETYSLANLAHRGWAFDGTVTAISGDQVTFRINEQFAGAGAGEITVTATGMTGTAVTSAGGPNLSIGERYLVAGEDEFAWACGFTQPYDPAVAAQWGTATGG